MVTGEQVMQQCNWWAFDETNVQQLDEIIIIIIIIIIWILKHATVLT